MARYQVIYWQHIPTMVIASENGAQARVTLPPRFQKAVDAYAMATGAADDETYSAGWRRGEWQSRAGAPDEVAQAVAAELDAEHAVLEIPRPNRPAA